MIIHQTTVVGSVTMASLAKWADLRVNFERRVIKTRGQYGATLGLLGTSWDLVIE